MAKKTKAETDLERQKWMAENGINPANFNEDELDALYKDYKREQKQADRLTGASLGEGRTTGGIYKAANPLEALGGLAQQAVGGKIEKKLSDKNALARKAMARELAKAVRGPQTTPVATPPPASNPAAAPAAQAATAVVAPPPQPQTPAPGGAGTPMGGSPNQQGPVRNAAPYQDPNAMSTIVPRMLSQAQSSARSSNPNAPASVGANAIRMQKARQLAENQRLDDEERRRAQGDLYGEGM